MSEPKDGEWEQLSLPLMDVDDVYPTDKTLDKIEAWDVHTQHPSAAELMAFVREHWAFSGVCWDEKDHPNHTEYMISTGGWSGNEEIVQAMRKNWMFWATCWREHRRGGHYVFEVRKP